MRRSGPCRSWQAERIATRSRTRPDPASSGTETPTPQTRRPPTPNRRAPDRVGATIPDWLGERRGDRITQDDDIACRDLVGNQRVAVLPALPEGVLLPGTEGGSEQRDAAKHRVEALRGRGSLWFDGGPPDRGHPHTGR
jgi:hypothetical protein